MEEGIRQGTSDTGYHISMPKTGTPATQRKLAASALPGWGIRMFLPHFTTKRYGWQATMADKGLDPAYWLGFARRLILRVCGCLYGSGTSIFRFFPFPLHFCFYVGTIGCDEAGEQVLGRFLICLSFRFLSFFPHLGLNYGGHILKGLFSSERPWSLAFS